MTNYNKILFLTGSYGVGGKERQLTELISFLPDNYMTYLIVNNSSGYYEDNVKQHLVEYYNLENAHFNVSSVIKIWKIIDFLKPDIIYSWSTTMSHIVLMKNILSKNKIILINGSIRDAPSRRTIFQHIESLLYNLYPFVVSNSLAGLRAYRQLGRKGRFVLNNGVDFSKYDYVSENKIKNELGLPQDSFVVTMIARIEKEKDYTNFVRSAAETVKYDNNCYFLIVGDGQMRGDILKLVKSLNILNNVRFLGIRSDIGRILSITSLSILLSNHGEGISNSIIESLCAGVPVDCNLRQRQLGGN